MAILIDYAVRSKERSVQKHCVTCGRDGWFRPRERRCRYRRFGVGSYCCWGDLVVKVAEKAKRARKLTTREAIQQMTLLGANEEAIVEARGTAQRARATKAFAKAQDMVKEKQTRIKRLQTSLRSWQKRVRAAERRLAMTDTQFEDERARMVRAAQIQKVRRRLIDAAGSTDEEIDAEVRVLFRRNVMAHWRAQPANSVAR